jgi:hypothetical protein
MDPDAFPKCYLSQSDCNMRDMTQATLVYTDTSTSRCFNGDAFAFLVHPGETDKLLFYMPGGGACWEIPDLWLPGAMKLCVDSMAKGLGSTGYGSGMMDFNDPRNTFKDYTAVSPPYCTGGAHIANTTVRHLFKTHYQYDYTNNEFARSWALKNVDQNLKSFVVMGASAGSLGTAVWSDLLLKTFKYEKASVFLDSYSGVFPDNTQGRTIRNFDACNLPIMANFRAACESGDATVQDMFDSILSRYPRVAFAQIQAKTDLIQRLFYSAIAVSYFDLNLILTSSNFYKETNKISQRYNRHPNFVTYTVDGDAHVFGPYPSWYTTSIAGDAAAPAGTLALYEWTDKVVNHERVTSQCNGPLKQNGERGSAYCDEALFPKTLAL